MCTRQYFDHGIFLKFFEVFTSEYIAPLKLFPKARKWLIIEIFKQMHNNAQLHSAI